MFEFISVCRFYEVLDLYVCCDERQAFVKQLWDTFIDQAYTSDKENGDTSIRWINGKAYRWVKNATGVATVIGDVLFWGTTDAAGLARTEVYQFGQSSKGTSAPLMAGVCLSAIAIAGWGWIQVYGICGAVNTLGHASGAISTSLKGVSGQSYVTFDVAVTAAPTFMNHILSNETWTTTSAAVKLGFVRCLN